MKKTLLTASMGAALICSPLAMAGDYYLKGGIGYVSTVDEETSAFPVDDFMEIEDAVTKVDFEADGGASLSVGLGVKINKFITTEFTLQHNLGSDLNGDIKINGETIAELAEDSDLYFTMDGEVKTTSIMATALVDVAALAEKNWSIKPYAGLGLGYAKNSLGTLTMRTNIEGGGEVSGSGGDDSGLAWKVVAGAVFPIDNNLSIDASYQYADYGSVKLVDDSDEVDLDVSAHEFTVGIRYSF